jgi:hypothetical protein
MILKSNIDNCIVFGWIDEIWLITVIDKKYIKPKQYIISLQISDPSDYR